MKNPKGYLMYDLIYTACLTILECFIRLEYLEVTEEEKNQAKRITLNIVFSSFPDVGRV